MQLSATRSSWAVIQPQPLQANPITLCCSSRRAGGLCCAATPGARHAAQGAEKVAARGLHAGLPQALPQGTRWAQTTHLHLANQPPGGMCTPMTLVLPPQVAFSTHCPAGLSPDAWSPSGGRNRRGRGAGTCEKGPVKPSGSWR